MRKRIFETIQRAEGDSRISRVYDIVLMVLIVASIIPLMFMTYHPAYRIIELVTVTVFTIDYLLRWITAGYLDGLRNNQEEKEKGEAKQNLQ